MSAVLHITQQTKKIKTNQLARIRISNCFPLLFLASTYNTITPSRCRFWTALCWHITNTTEMRARERKKAIIKIIWNEFVSTYTHTACSFPKYFAAQNLRKIVFHSMSTRYSIASALLFYFCVLECIWTARSKWIIFLYFARTIFFPRLIQSNEREILGLNGMETVSIDKCVYSIQCTLPLEKSKNHFYFSFRFRLLVGMNVVDI